MLKNLSTIPLTFFLARRKEALKLPASIESGHTPFFISLLGRVSVCVSGLCPALDLAEREARTPTSSSGDIPWDAVDAREPGEAATPRTV